MAWMGHPTLYVRCWCDVCLVLGSDIRHPFITGIVVATGVVNMVTSRLLMYYVVRTFWIINKIVACIAQMQRPGVHPPFQKKIQSNERIDNNCGTLPVLPTPLCQCPIYFALRTTPGPVSLASPSIPSSSAPSPTSSSARATSSSLFFSLSCWSSFRTGRHSSSLEDDDKPNPRSGVVAEF